MKRRIKVEVYQGDSYSIDWPPKNAIEFIAWLKNELQKIDPIYREKTCIEIDSGKGYDGDTGPFITIYYERYETDLEMEHRQQQEIEIQNRMREKELKLLSDLKTKYGQ